MNRYEIYELLSAERRGILILEIKIESWGQKVSFQCLYDWEEKKPFKLTFNGCHQLNWEVVEVDEILDDSLEADVIAILLGKSHYEEKAYITTTEFEIGVLYDEFIIQKDW
jgi:hypothetical protein